MSFESQYELGEELGRGSFGVVKTAQCKRTGVQRAVKIVMKRRDISSSCLKQEADLLSALNHTGIVKLIEVMESPTHVFIVMELMKGGELMQALTRRGTYDENNARTLVKQILEAALYLHQQGIIHRDLKPENILLVSDDANCLDVKIADLGLSLVVDESTMIRQVVGTPLFMAPEVLRGKAYTAQADMWSIGVIAYLLLSGKPPFIGENEAALRKQVQKCDVQFSGSVWQSISDSAKNFVLYLLRLNPSERYDAQEALRHPWLTGQPTRTQQLDTVLDLMRSFNIERKFKKSVFAVMAVNRFQEPLTEQQRAT